MAVKDYYKALGVASSASQEEIRKAYRRLTKEFHPDRRKGSKAAEARFKEISEAYSVLGDPEKRKQYDMVRQSGIPFGVGAGDAGAWTQGAGGFDFSFGGWGDLLNQMMGGARGSPPHAMRRHGADVARAITIPFDTAARGGTVEVVVPREVSCASCSGSGAAPGGKSSDCPQCGGRGQVLSGQAAFSRETMCPTCRGTGRVVQKPCRKCRGTGTVEESVPVSVKIPAGIDDGHRMRLKGMGEPGLGGGAPGNLLLEVHVQPHPHFERKGRNLHSRATVEMADAALGTELEVQTMHGAVTLKVPPGIQPGQKLRVAGHGLKTSDGRKGDHFVEIQVRIPMNLTEEQRRLLEQLRRAPARARE